MVAALAPSLSMALTKFGAFLWAASPVDGSSFARDNIVSTSLSSSSVSTLETASYVLVVDLFLSSGLFDPHQGSFLSTQRVDLNGIGSNSSFGENLYDAAANTTTTTTALSQIPTLTGTPFTPEPSIAMNGLTAESSIIMSKLSWIHVSTNLPSAHTRSNIPLALPIVTLVVLGIILFILLMFSILLCRRIRSTDHDVEGGIRVTAAVGHNRMQHIQLPAMPKSPIYKTF